MRFGRFLLLISACVSLAFPAAAQQNAAVAATPQPPQRDAQAVAAIQKAVSALGGSSLAQVRDSSVQGVVQNLSDASAPQVTLKWEDSWGKGAPAFRRESHVGASTSVLVSGNGQPVDFQDGIATKVPKHVALGCAALHVPGIVLAYQLNDSRYVFKFVENTIFNGQAAMHIQSALNSDPILSALSLEDWYFDPASGLPLGVAYRIADKPDLLNPGTVSVQFADFRQVSGFLTPFRLTEMGLAGEKDVVNITSATFNSSLSPSEFLAPAGAAQ